MTTTKKYNALTETTTLDADDTIISIVDSANNTLKQITKPNLVATLISTDADNKLSSGSDDNLFASDTTDASKLTSGLLPDARLNDTAVTAGSYTSADLTIDAKGRIILASNGASVDIDYVDYTTYSVNSAVVDSDGYADFIARVSDTELSYNMTKSITRTFTDGSQQTVTTTPNITGISADGAYTIIKQKGVTTPIATTVTITEDYTKPTSPLTGDLHTDISVKPYQQYERNALNTDWTLLSGDDLFVKDGQVTKDAGVILEADVISYALNGIYIGSPTAQSISITYSYNHNIGSNLIQHDLVYKCIVSEKGYSVGDTLTINNQSYANSNAYMSWNNYLQCGFRWNGATPNIKPKYANDNSISALNATYWQHYFIARRGF